MRRNLIPSLALLVAAAACGSNHTGTLTPVAQVQAAAKGIGVGSSKVDISVHSQAASQDVTISGTGAFAYSGGSATGAMSLSYGTQSIEERILGDALYLKLPNQNSFYKVSLKDLVGSQLADTSDPSSAAKILAAIDAVSKVGTKTIHGNKTTGYSGSIDVAKAAARFKGGALQGAVSKLEMEGVTSIPVVVYLDSKGRVNELTENLTVTVQGVQDKVTTTIDLYDYGTKVNVSAPPADQVKDGSQIVAALKGQGG